MYGVYKSSQQDSASPVADEVSETPTGSESAQAKDSVESTNKNVEAENASTVLARDRETKRRLLATKEEKRPELNKVSREKSEGPKDVSAEKKAYAASKLELASASSATEGNDGPKDVSAEKKAHAASKLELASASSATDGNDGPMDVSAEKKAHVASKLELASASSSRMESQLGSTGDNLDEELGLVQNEPITGEIVPTQATEDVDHSALIQAFVPELRAAARPEEEVIAAEKIIVDNEDESRRRRNRILVCVAVFILVVGLAVGLGVGLTRVNSSGEDDPIEQRASANPSMQPSIIPTNFPLPSQSPTVSLVPSSTPTEVPTSEGFALVSADIRSDLGEATFEALADSASPQAKAARWISEEDTFFTFPLSTDPAVRSAFVQRYSLAVFFFSTGGFESWADHVRFLTPAHECNWQRRTGIERGIDCNQNLEVVGMYFPVNNLTGAIPDEIRELRQLFAIDLYDNQISGTLPEGLFSLENLRTLHLPYNPLTGSLSPSVENLVNVFDFWLEDAAMTGSLPETFAGMSSIGSVDITRCGFNGTLPQIWNTPQLRRIALDGNAFTGSIPDFRGAPAILSIDIKENNLTGALPETLMALDVLNSVNFRLNALSGPIPDFQDLESLILDGNMLTGPFPVSVVSEKVELIDLSENMLTGHLPDFSNATSLFGLSVFDNMLSGEIPAGLASLNELFVLGLSNCKFSGSLPVLSNPDLSILTLEGNMLTGDVGVATANLSSLTFASFGLNSFTGDLTGLCMRTERINMNADCAGDDPEVNCPCCQLCFDRNGESFFN